MHSLRGMVTNQGAPDLVCRCNPEWMYAEFGPVTRDLSRSFTRAGGSVIPWALHHFDAVPNPDDVRLAMQHPSYSGWHILGHNEPDISGGAPGAPWTPTPIPPAVYVELCIAQMDAVRTANPQAQFVVWGGTQWHPLFVADEWFWQVWKLFPRGTHRNYIRAVGTDYYVQGGGRGGRAEHPEVWLSPEPIQRYFWKFRVALDAAGLPGRELWCHEIGLGKDERLSLADAAQYPVTVQQAMDAAGVDRWSWYAQVPDRDYLTLLDAARNLTPWGQAFAAM